MRCSGRIRFFCLLRSLSYRPSFTYVRQCSARQLSVQRTLTSATRFRPLLNCCCHTQIVSISATAPRSHPILLLLPDSAHPQLLPDRFCFSYCPRVCSCSPNPSGRFQLVPNILEHSLQSLLGSEVVLPPEHPNSVVHIKNCNVLISLCQSSAWLPKGKGYIYTCTTRGAL